MTLVQTNFMAMLIEGTLNRTPTDMYVKVGERYKHRTFPRISHQHKPMMTRS